MKRKNIYTIIIALLAMAAVVATAVLSAKGIAATNPGWFIRTIYILCGIFTFLSAAASIVVTTVMNIIDNNR